MMAVWDRLIRGVRTLTIGLAAAIGSTVAPAAAVANQDGELRFFRIATGGINGTYYPIGGIIANAISKPPGSRPCGEGGSCGVPNLLAAAVSSHGSVANVEAIQAGEIESGFAQADVLRNAYLGEGPFAGRPPLTKLRAIAHLYSERVQLVARNGSAIGSVGDLAGRRVSLDEPGSGTLLLARLVLAAAGVEETDLVADYLKAGPAASLLLRGELDAFFLVAGVPTTLVADLVADNAAILVPLDGPAIEALLQKHPYLTRSPIAAETYGRDTPMVDTIGVGAQWVVSADASEDLVYAICRSLWSEATAKLLASSHPAGSQILLETALEGIEIPLHPGAERCYAELMAPPR